MGSDDEARADAMTDERIGDTIAEPLVATSAAWPAPPAAAGYICVGATRTTFPGDREAARADFARTHALHLAQLFEPAFLKALLRLSASTQFKPGSDAPGFREVEASPQPAGRVMNLALNRPELLRWLEDVTGCGHLNAFEGRLVQTLNRPGDLLLWHDDQRTTEGRRLALVVDLSTESYEGGEFQIRHKGGENLFEHHYERAGSALIFEVNSTLEHRVLPLSAGGPRRVFAGWAFAGEVQ